MALLAAAGDAAQAAPLEAGDRAGRVTRTRTPRGGASAHRFGLRFALQALVGESSSLMRMDEAQVLVHLSHKAQSGEQAQAF